MESIHQYPTVLDETQYLPELFPALKEQVRRNKRPGQFILTGSVRFSSRRKIRESLTGRIIYYELFPMDLSEIEQKPLPDTLIRPKGLSPRGHGGNLSTVMEQYLRRGGLPGLFHIRKESLFNQKISTQIETILERDLRLLYNTSLSFQSLRTLLTYFALHQNEPLEMTDVARATRISRPTLMKLKKAFESLFLIRELPCEGSSKKPVYMMEDQGEASYLIGRRTDPLYDLTRFLYANLRCQIHYRPEVNGQIFQYRTRGGALVPLCFRLPKGEIGVIPVLEDYPSPQAIKSASSFLKAYPNGKILFATWGNKSVEISPRSRVLPALALVRG